MTLGGWLVMALSVGTVCLLFAWCMFKVMRKPTEPEHMKGITDRTPDQSED